MLFKNKRFILGSKSPRRAELLRGMDIKFNIDTDNNFNEDYPPLLEKIKVPEFLSKGKSLSFHRDLETDEILITADTMVLCSNEILGKPKDREEAIYMLNLLSGKTHKVITGVTIRTNESIVSFSDISEVAFKILSKEEIDYYITHYKPYDKAGGYGIQEWIGHIGIREIKGSYFNIMGLPVQKLYDNLLKLL